MLLKLDVHPKLGGRRRRLVFVLFVQAGVEFAFRVGTKFQTTRLVQWPVTELLDILYCFLVYSRHLGCV